MNKLLAGFVAGLLATVPMTIAMAALQKVLMGSADEKLLPPYQVTMRVADDTKLRPRTMDKEEQTGLFAAAHFLIGGLAGALYGLLVPLLPLSGTPRGILYGLLFWAANYLGTLPGLDIYSLKEGDEAGRVGATFGAHIVFGAALDATLGQLTKLAEDS